MGALAITASLLAIIIGLIYVYLKRLGSYWDRRNCPTEDDNVFFGGFKDMMLMRLNPQATIRKLYEKTKGQRFFGTFMMLRPVIFVRDPEIVKEVLLKDFANFPGNGFYINEERDPLSGTLINLTGEKWKNMRTKLTHAFTSSKIKYMFRTMTDCIERLHVYLDKKLAVSGKNLDLKDTLSCLGTDIIASVAFGIDVNSIENPDNEFRAVGKRMSTPNFFFFIKIFMILSLHKLAYLFNVSQADSKSHAFIMDLVKRTVEYREKNNIVRPDLLNLLLQMKNKGYIENVEGLPGFKTEETGRITLNEITAQVFLFYQAGSETSSTTLTFALYEMCLNEETQRKLQAECDEVLAAHGGKITYEATQNMPYADKVISETLRLHPVVGGFFRQAANDCKLPLTDVQLEKGTGVAIPLSGLHMDPEYWPDPEKFDPERFTKENEAKRPSFVYMPFSEGPRICIGNRFAMVQIKAVLLALMSRYDFEISEETPYPLEIDPRHMIPLIKKLTFNVTKRTDVKS